MKEIDDDKDGSIIQDDNQINTDSSKLDDQINTDSNKINNEEVKEAEKQTRKQRKEALWAKFQQNRRDIVIDYSDYEEYETLDEMKEAYQSQPTIEDKFYYYINLQARAALLSGSIKHLTEKERVALGMYPNIFENKVRPGFPVAPISHDQNNREYDMTMDFLYDLRLEFFANDQGKKSVTIEGCRGFMEMRGRVEKVVERINKVRGAENMNHKDHVDITKYGPERAEKAALERMKRDSGAKEKDLKNIRPVKL
ncbi:MAG: hypothetical protein K6C35_08505 [Eubacterium sp.]|nr:hypothetical protein [Eubacterium sp.]